jgi:hypothetical protein
MGCFDQEKWDTYQASVEMAEESSFVPAPVPVCVPDLKKGDASE